MEGVYASTTDGDVGSWQVFDNSLLAAPRLIANQAAGEPQRVIDLQAWRHLLDLSQ